MKQLLIALCGLILVGCVGTERVAGADKVKVVCSRVDVPPGELLGDSMGYCGNWWNSIFLSHDFMYENAMNMIKNNAVAMNGNYVYVQQINPNAVALIFYGNVYRVEEKGANKALDLSP